MYPVCLILCESTNITLVYVRSEKKNRIDASAMDIIETKIIIWYDHFKKMPTVDGQRKAGSKCLLKEAEVEQGKAQDITTKKLIGRTRRLGG